MKPKQTLILFLLVALVVAGIAAYELAVAPAREKKPREKPLLFPGLDEQKATEISILKGSTATVLLKDGDTAWVVETEGRYLADPGQVSSLLSDLAGITMSEPASQNKKNHEALGVGDKGVRIKIKQDKDVAADLVVGLPGPDHVSTFVRKADADTVYLVPQNLESLVEKGGGAWRDQRIFSSSADEVEEINLTTWPEAEAGSTSLNPPSPPETMVIKRGAELGSWELVIAGDTTISLDSSKTSALANNLATLTASDFDENNNLAAAGLDHPKKIAVFKLKDKRTYTLLVGKKDNSKYYVKRPDRDAILKVYLYNINNIFKGKDALMPTEGAEGGQGFDPGSFLPAPQLQGVPPGMGGQE